MSMPGHLFKYEPFTVQSLQNLKNQVIYFGSPRNFNDPYDCALSPAIKEITGEEAEAIRASQLARADVPDAARRGLEGCEIENLRRLFMNSGKSILHEKVEEFSATNGVSCFSEKNDNLLMWSHYAACGKGFCLEFSTSANFFQKVLPVRYSATMPLIDVCPYLMGATSEQMLELFCTKSIDWAYEKEWRAIHNVGGTAYGYGAALTGVYCGPDMPLACIEIIALILNGQNENVHLWMGHRSKTRFAVEFELKTYIPHLAAKRKGLIGGGGREN